MDLRLPLMLFYVCFLDLSGVFEYLYLPFLYYSWELFLLMIEGNLTLLIFYWLWLLCFAWDLLSVQALFY